LRRSPLEPVSGSETSTHRTVLYVITMVTALATYCAPLYITILNTAYILPYILPKIWYYNIKYYYVKCGTSVGG
jgi:hypothetical protein